MVQKRFSKRVLLILAVHAAAFATAYWLAYALRKDFEIPTQLYVTFWLTLPGVLMTKLLVFYVLGQCHGWWRYVTFSDLASLLKAATLSTIVLAAIDRFAVNHDVPRAVLPLDWMLTVILLGGLRCVWRLSREQFWPILRRKDMRRALIVGANYQGESLARQLASDPRLHYQIAGFLDADPSRLGSVLGSIPVVGRPDQAAKLAATYSVDDILVISGTLSGKQLRDLMVQCKGSELSLKVLPDVDELLKSNYRVQVRDVDINDLLHRDPIELNNEAIGGLLAGKRVLVTGAGGSIGSEICRQVLRFEPKQLLLVEQAENSLFLIEQELLRHDSTAQLVPLIADICDPVRMGGIFEQFRPDVVFHAAAHKHVPMMEHNPGEAIKNNVLGTKLLVELAHQHAVESFVMISTDKAVNPTSVMGGSKQLAERFVHAFSENSSTRFVVVRFGNVLGSNGSVVPIFKEQIQRGGPVTVTHPDIERYFMTIPEASQLVLQAAAMGSGGEIFVLDMGEPVRIADLAADLIRLSGFSTDEVEIVFTGLRPGEKLYEELYFRNEETLPTPHPKVFVAYHRPFTLSEVSEQIRCVSEAMDGPADELRRRLKSIMPEYLGADAAPQADLAAS